MRRTHDGRRGLVARLAQVAQNAATRGRSTVPAIVVGRATDGSLQVVPVGGECPERAQGQHAIGEVLQSSTEPLRAGSGGLTGSRRTVTGATVWLERQIPADVARGGVREVLLLGRGLRPDMQVDWLLDGKRRHPGVTVGAVTATTSPVAGLDALRVVLVVAPDAALTPDACPIAYQRRPSAPVAGMSTAASERPGLYRVVPAPGDLRYLAYFVVGGQLICWSLTSNGVYFEEVGRAPLAAGWRWDRSVRLGHDATDSVGADALIWCTGPRIEGEEGASAIHVADVRNNVSYSWTDIVGDVIGAGYADGHIHFLTWQFLATSRTNTIRHYRIKPTCELPDIPETYLMHVLEIDSESTTDYETQWVEAWGLMFAGRENAGGRGINAFFRYVDLGGVYEGYGVNIRMPYDSAEPQAARYPSARPLQTGGPWDYYGLAGRWAWDGYLLGEGGGGSFAEMWPQSWLDGLGLTEEQRERVFTSGSADFAASWIYHSRQIYEFRPFSGWETPDRVVDLPDHPILGRPAIVVPI